MESLEEMAKKVMIKMHTIPQLAGLSIGQLETIPLGYLRKNATRLHAVCRYKRGVRKKNVTGPSDVNRVDVHPDAMSEKWSRYASFLLYHEFLHALGFTSHNQEFRKLEALWPDTESQSMGKTFGKYLQDKSIKWHWQCPSCELKHSRTRKSNGRYRCRNCRIVLVDIPVKKGE
ncbi:MAG: hypothetical protein QF440_00400 [Candidatus Thalassarchaeaceae archaeon]|jgi:predicted RNA-binding Zn-ribbon protein involved in translation (DUF1610 family)|nr:hypothetical protein [Candidatus Thalassarchaeaceae archaeon]